MLHHQWKLLSLHWLVHSKMMGVLNAAALRIMDGSQREDGYKKNLEELNENFKEMKSHVTKVKDELTKVEEENTELIREVKWMEKKLSKMTKDVESFALNVIYQIYAQVKR